MSIVIKSNFNPSFTGAIDARLVVANIAALANISKPFVGLRIWVTDLSKLIIVTSVSTTVDPLWGTTYQINGYKFTPLVVIATRKVTVGSNSLTIPNDYTLPAATASTLGGVKVGSNLAVTADGTLSGDYSVVTSSANGLMSATDKAKLDKSAVSGRKVTIGSNSVTVPEEYSVKYGSATVTEIAAGSNVTITEASGKITVAATDTTYNEATTSAAGLMSAADKTKLDGLKGGFKGYFATPSDLPAASGCNVGDFAVVGSTDTVWVIDDNGGTKAWKDTGAHSVTPKWSDITDKPTTIAGYAITDAKITDRKVTLGSNSITVPVDITYDSAVVKEIAAGSNVTITKGTNGLITVAATDTTYSEATQSAAGLMSAADKTKLDKSAVSGRKVTIGSNSITVPLQYTLPTASSDTLGGIKVGTNLSIDDNGILSATDTTYAVATESNSGLLSAVDKKKINNLNLGTVKVTISGATTGKWSINGGATWNDSGSIVTVLAGKYQVVYKDVDGYKTPAAEVVTVSAGGEATATGTYTAAKYVYYGYIPNVKTSGASLITEITQTMLNTAVTAGTVVKTAAQPYGLRTIASVPSYSWMFAIVPAENSVKVMNNCLGVDSTFSDTDAALNNKCANGSSMTLGSDSYKAYGCVQTVSADAVINFIAE